MGDAQRCFKCGGDRIATTIKDGKPLCNRCAGLPDVFADLTPIRSLQFDKRFKSALARSNQAKQEQAEKEG